MDSTELSEVVAMNMSDRTPGPKRLLEWYRRHARPLLAEHVAENKISLLDDDCRRLDGLYTRPDNIHVCFIGNSAVGKSTLLNALVTGDRQLLPSGGIGPLTALATTLQHGPKKRFTVKYHKKAFLRKIGASLDGRLIHERRLRDKIVNELRDQLGEEEASEVDEIVIPAKDEGLQQQSTRLEEYVKMATQLITGRQVARDDSVGLAYLADGLRLACDLDTKWGSTLIEEDQARLEQLFDRFSLAEEGKAYVCEEDGNVREFMRSLHDHAAGFLAPIVESITFEWPSDLLQDGVVLVDLPGVGIANDRYRPLTQEHIRERADAVVLVVNKSGLTESCIELLRSSGYWDRLIGASDSLAENACSLLVAVTHVDEVAKEEWARMRDTLPKGERPRKASVYRDESEKVAAFIRQQAKGQLGKLSIGESDEMREIERKAVDFVLRGLVSHVVCAPEYRRNLADDEDDPPFLGEDDTCIPAIKESIRHLAIAHRNRLRREISDVGSRLFRGISGELDMLRDQWSPEERQRKEVDRLEHELGFFLPRLREQAKSDEGAFREYLKATVQEQIEKVVAQARDEAEIEVRSYLRRLRALHWATLRAAVRRGGTWVRGIAQPIDLPEDIALRFQAPVAAVWSTKLLAPLRTRTHDYASDVFSLVAELHNWAQKEAEANIPRSLLAKQKRRIEDQREQMKDVGKEAVQELRALVKSELNRKIQGPIRRACTEFVNKGDDIGPGVKIRILGLFDDLSERSTKWAETPARNILTERFREVEAEIRRAFEEWGDPLSEAADIIMQKHGERTSKADQEMADRIRLAIDEVLARLTPQGFDADEDGA